MNALQCARYVYKTEGIRGFYRGLTASYAGISETMICFLIYETLKKYLAQSRFTTPSTDTEKGASDFLGLMFAAAFAKGCASCIAYPHGRLLLPVCQHKPVSTSLCLNIYIDCFLHSSGSQTGVCEVTEGLCEENAELFCSFNSTPP